MKEQKGLEIAGLVEEALPQGLYRVRLDNGSRVLASVDGLARKIIVKVLPGDRVLVETSVLDPSRGRIKQKST